MAYKIGNKIAWIMGDNNTMAGEIVDVLWDTYQVKRVDGGICTVRKHICYLASPEDIDSAISFFRFKNFV